MTGGLAAAYHSGAQRARVVTEAWGEKNLFCPNCSCPKLTWLEPGHPASDYSCPDCGFWYQLKSQKSRIGDSITDGAYAAMMNAIRCDELPSFYFMHYEIMPSLAGAGEGGPEAAGPDEGRGKNPIKSPRPDPLPTESRGEGMLWLVRNLLLVPHFAFPPSAIIKRKPTTPKGRSKPWIGCNFNLSRIPVEARIEVVRTITSQGRARSSTLRSGATAEDGPSEPRRDRDIAPYQQTIITPATEVREKFRRVKPLKDISVTQRGWTLDVLNIVRRLVDSRRRGNESGSAAEKGASLLTSAPTGEFSTADAYAFTRELEKLHPDNQHVKDKIRQQLQVLRDAGLLIHIGRGEWRLP